MNSIQTFMYGGLTMLSFIAAVIFARFWRSTAERLFLYFAISFSILAGDWMALALMPASAWPRHYLFVIRLVAFALLIVGIVDKNRR
jgi:hypothetical protein